jgi:NADPH:quinone reductase-like Zn-dependent oxidoreductase
MRSWQVQEAFGLDNLKIAELEAPTPGPGEVCVDVAACSLNRRDLMTVEGEYNPRQPLPLIPVSDGVGRISAVGDGVTEHQVGDRVAALFCQRWQGGAPTRDKLRSTLGGPLDGMLTEQRVLPASGVAKVPAHLSDEEAATLPCAALTAWSALYESAGVQPGQWVLVLGTGGVSVFAVQLAKLAGAHVAVTSSSDEKLATMKELGADVLVNYREHAKWGDVVRKQTGGVDHVVEVGGAGTIEQSIRATKLGGSLQLIGVLAGHKAELALTPVFMGQRRIQGLLVGHKDGFEAMCAAIDAAQLRPVLDRTFAFDDARAAFEHMKANQHLGKICIRTTAGA